jgi:hypothetical protein
MEGVSPLPTGRGVQWHTEEGRHGHPPPLVVDDQDDLIQSHRGNERRASKGHHFDSVPVSE